MTRTTHCASCQGPKLEGRLGSTRHVPQSGSLPDLVYCFRLEIWVNMVPSRPVALRRSIGHALSGNLAYTTSQFIILMSVIHLTSTQLVGEYAFALALSAPVFLLAGLKLRHVQVTDARSENRLGEYVALRAISSAIAVVVCLAIGLLTLASNPMMILASVVAFKAVEAQVDVLYGALQRLEMMDVIARSMLARAIAGSSAFALVLWGTNSLPMALNALTVTTLLFLFRETRRLQGMGRSPSPEFSGKRMLRLAVISIPLGISVSVGSITTNVPRYALQFFQGSTDVGIYASIAYALIATGMIGGAAAEASSPRLANLHAQSNHVAFRRLTLKLAVFGTALGLVGLAFSILLGKPVLRAVFGAEYADQARVLVILMVAATMQYSSLAVGAAVYAMRLFAVQVPINALGLLVAAVTGVFLVQRFGLEGAAWSVVATQAVLGLCYVGVFIAKMPRKHVPF